MAKTKIIIEVEIENNKLPENWEKDLEKELYLLDEKNVYFSNGTRGFIKIKKISFEK